MSDNDKPRIIKQGNMVQVKQTKCNHCGCEFEFGSRHVEASEGFSNSLVFFIACPMEGCGKQVFVTELPNNWMDDAGARMRAARAATRSSQFTEGGH